MRSPAYALAWIICSANRRGWALTSPAVGIAYSLWLRLRWGAAGTLIYLFCLAIAARFFYAAAEAVVLALVLLTASIAHLLHVFTLGPADFGVKSSGYPTSMFVLPVQTWLLTAGATPRAPDSRTTSWAAHFDAESHPTNPAHTAHASVTPATVHLAPGRTSASVDIIRTNRMNRTACRGCVRAVMEKVYRRCRRPTIQLQPQPDSSPYLCPYFRPPLGPAELLK
jgi:hypothetical protein